MSQQLTAPANPPAPATPLRVWFQAYRVEVTLFLVSFFVFAAFSSQRFWRQSAAPHFVYQAKAMLEGRSDIDPEVLPNFEDWACVRDVGGAKKRCEGAPLPGDRWYSSFPWFPAVVMAPFVVVHGYQFNDTSFGVIVAALAVALFYALLRVVKDTEGTKTTPMDDAITAVLLGFGTLFFYAALRGEVWFSAEVMGVAFTALYARNAVGARRPLLAGVFWSMAVMTRTPLFFTGVFFLIEVMAPQKGDRMKQFKAMTAEKKKALGRFIGGAAPLGLLAAAWNVARFGSPTEFGHKFFFNNRVNHDIDTWGLFHPHYLGRNLDAAFLKLPGFVNNQLRFDFWGLSLFITLPLLALCFVPEKNQKRALQLVGAMFGLLVASALLGIVAPDAGEPPIGARPTALWLVLALVLAFFAWSAWEWVKDKDAPRLLVPVLLTIVACMLPGLFYQNTGYAQFGFRFSLDYTPWLLLLLPLGGWSWKKPLPMALALASIAAGFWGAVAFRGYTELTRGWQ
ncbi:MAG: hypothetical protein U0228_36300 [Myxococcaceae bacterium]